MQFGLSEKEYVNKELYQAHILEQYKIYADRLGVDQGRNETTNSFFMTMNTAVVTALVFAAQSIDEFELSGIGFITVFAVAVCLVWWMVLLSLSRWQAAQLETLQEIEALLPLKPFMSEWHEKMSNKKSYIKIRVVRQCVPWIFMAVHLGMYMALKG